MISQLIESLTKSLRLLYVVDPFKNDPLPGKLRYLRLHGIGGFHYRYTDAELRRLADVCREATQTTYCMFNNVPMLDDARRFVKLLQPRSGERM